jgi:YD repeat-containing protein
VTGSGFANVSEYASQMQYRAWGVLKHLTYGSGRGLDLGYDSRLRITGYKVSGTAAYDQRMELKYSYNGDGRVRYVQDVVDAKFDRAYEYDQMGRLTEATSGVEARSAATSTDRPYKETFEYDVWGNGTKRTTQFWSAASSQFTATYVNNRVQNNSMWQYDADGRVTQPGDTQHYTYDAAGRKIQATTPPGYKHPALTVTQGFDGDGLRVKKTETHGTSNNIRYYIRSSVLGGQVLTELTETGEKYTGYVYANGDLLAKQNQYLQVAMYEHTEPSRGREASSYTGHDDMGGEEHLFFVTQLDPLNNNVEESDPALDPGDSGGDSGGGVPGTDGNDYPNYGSGFDTPTQCAVNDVPTDCGMVLGAVGFSNRRVGDFVGMSYGGLRGGYPTPVFGTAINITSHDTIYDDDGYVYWTEQQVEYSIVVLGFNWVPGERTSFNHPWKQEPQKPAPDPHGRSEKFLNCARKAGLGWLLTEDAWKNGHRFNDANASFINRLSDATGVNVGLLGFTFDHEGRFDQQASPNTNNSQDRGNWDFGPFQLNYYQTVRDSFAGDYSVAGIDLDAAFGRLGTATLNPFENGRLAGRKLAWLVNGARGNLATAAGRFRSWSGSDFTSRRDSWNTEGRQFQSFFDCFGDR